MNRATWIAMALGCLMTLTGQPALAEDIDIFVGGSGDTSANPNVLIVLDNSANWSAANQNWPTDANPTVACGSFCDKQGYYELKALRTVINGLPTDAVNVGLMMFNESNSSRNGGYVRSAVKPMTAANKAAFLAKLDAIMADGNGETGSSSVQYASILWDVFKYFGGYTTPSLANKDQAPASNPTYGTVPVFGTRFWGTIDGGTAARADAAAYTGSATGGDYVPVAAGCNQNFVIFIGNGFPSQDSNTMAQVLNSLKNPAVAANSSVSEFKLPAYSCNGSWSNASGYNCRNNNANPDCAGELPASSESTLYRCDAANCGGNSARVQQCTSIALTLTAPAGNATSHFGDEFADFLYSTDVNSQVSQQNVVIHTLNVFKDRPSNDQAALLRNMAYYGGGMYFTANSLSAIVDALQKIFVNILTVNSTFASASLPINTTNRSQNRNEVYIPQFRPDADAKPRWFGNLKRYQLISDANGNVRLGDANGNPAIDLDNAANGCNASSSSANCAGYIDKCAVSWWTTDSPDSPSTTDGQGYWRGYNLKPTPVSSCNTALKEGYSDYPDGRQVEKGAVAEVVRKGNNPAVTNASPTWAANRTVYTASGTTLQAFNAANTGLAATLVNWVLGKDTEDENKDTNLTQTRASVHGDVIHSRPLPVDHGSNGGVVIYYGANDGNLRAVDADSGTELWAFVAPEFNSRLDRLRTQTPLVNFPGVPASLNPAPRDYFFDGSIGLYQNADNTKVMIYPTMRRGGRMMYSIDVHAPTSPSIAWKFGCDPSGSCTAGASGMGQTWSNAQPAFVRDSNVVGSEYPMVMFGGGYDACEDANTATPSCGAAKGAMVYAVDAVTGPGSWLWSATTDRSVVADVAFVDLDRDGLVDHAYAVDTGGNIYRASFVDANRVRVSRAQWKFTKIASTGGGRKFLFAPSLVPTRDKSGKDYVYLAVGSGDREHPLATHYPYTASVVNKLFVILDDVTKTDVINLDDTSSSAVLDCTTEATCANKPLLPGGTARAWFMNLTAQGKGEQTVTSPLIVAGQIVFSTNRPTPVPAGSCAPSLGEARGYWLDLLTSCGTIGAPDNTCTGTRSGTFVGGGLPPSPVIGTVPVNDVPTTVVIGAVEKMGGGALSSSINAQKPIVSGKSPRKSVYRMFKGDN